MADLPKAPTKTLYMEPDEDGKYYLRSGSTVEERVTSLKELLVSTIGSVEEKLQQRLAGIDEATKLVRADLVRVPSEVDVKLGGAMREIQAQFKGMDEVLETEKHLYDQKISGLRELVISEIRTVVQRFRTVDERFSTIDTQFEERDVRVKENKTAADTGVAAAFAASEKVGQEQNRNFKELIDKSEAATGKQIDQILGRLEEMAKALNDKIAGQESRIVRYETMVQANALAQANAQTQKTSDIANRQGAGGNIIALVVGAGVVILAIVDIVFRMVK